MKANSHRMRWIVLFCLLALPATAEPWIAYGWSGGIAGRIVSIEISQEGEVVYQANREPARRTTLSKKEIDELRAEIPSAFPKPERHPAVPDGINYALQVGDQKAVWGTPDPVPECLGPLVDHLSRIQNKLNDSPAP